MVGSFLLHPTLGDASSGGCIIAQDDSINFLYATERGSIGYVIWNFIGVLKRGEGEEEVEVECLAGHRY